jgi:hypothetical protein
VAALVGLLGAGLLAPLGAGAASTRGVPVAVPGGLAAPMAPAPAPTGCSDHGVGAPGASSGYWVAGADGSVYSCGDAPWDGSLTSQHVAPDGPVVGIATCNSGFWLVTAAGAVYAFGGNLYLGGVNSAPLPAPIVGMAATGDCLGYWLVGADGEVYSIEDADNIGSPVTIAHQGVVGMAAVDEPLAFCRVAREPCATGYWVAGADGGVFTYSTTTQTTPTPGVNGYGAFYLGSLPGCGPLNRPVVAMVAWPDPVATGPGPTCRGAPEPPGGYWLLGADGGVFAFGDAPYLGSTGCLSLNRPVVGMVATPDTTTVGRSTACLAPGATLDKPGGYLTVGADGGVFPFGNATYAGSLPGSQISVGDIVGLGLYTPEPA